MSATDESEMPFQTRLRLAGLLGVVGMAMGVAADLASGYATGSSGEVVSAFSVLALENLDPFLAAKPFGQVVVGHYLAVLGIPLGIFGFWQVYRGIRPAGRWLPRLVWFLGVWGFVVGTVFHASFAFVVAGIQADTGTGSLEPMLARFATVFEPVGLLLVAVMTVALVLLFYLVAFRETRYPRWFALVNPLLLQAVAAAIALVAPEPVRIVLVVTAYNLSVLLFFVVSTALLWSVEPRRATPERPGETADA